MTEAGGSGSVISSGKIEVLLLFVELQNNRQNHRPFGSLLEDIAGNLIADEVAAFHIVIFARFCLLYTSPSPRD